jgi:ubiquinone/menaquinone biosynthesis C-methylase UbiE
MKRSTLDLLCCPECHAELELRDERGDGTVVEGNLVCSRCGRGFTIREGTPRFISEEELGDRDRRFSRFYDWFSRFEGVGNRVAFLGMGGERRARGEILNRLDVRSGRVLEVSIGSGGNLPYLFELPGVRDVYGLDISLGQLDRCGRLAAKRGWSVDLVLAAAEKMPFRAESFDCVLHVGGINFFSEKGRAIDEMIRVARPGSKIVIADESERLARFIARIPGLSGSGQGGEVDTSVPVHLVPEAMEEVRVDGIWRVHGRHHGYCLEFRKPG